MIEQEAIYKKLLQTEESFVQKRTNKVCLVSGILLFFFFIVSFIFSEINLFYILLLVFNTVWCIHHLIMLIILNKFGYKPLYKYLTSIINLLIVWIAYLQTIISYDLVFAIRTEAFLVFYILLALSTYFHDAKLIIVITIINAIIYTSIFFYAILFTNVILLPDESFIQNGIAFTNLLTRLMCTVLPGILLALTAKRFHLVLSNSIKSATKASIFEREVILKRKIESRNKKLNKQKRQLTAAYNEISSLNVKQTSLFINLTHEIKTPLTLVRNYFGKYLKGRPLNSDLKVIRNEIDKLTGYILNFMDIEKIERGKIFYDDMVNLDLSEFISDIVTIFASFAAEKGIALEEHIEGDIIYRMSPAAIDRILNNLIDNAIRYTEKGGSIRISLRKENNEIVIIIEDTGIGIEKEKQKYIFDKYYQITREKSNMQGMGMGLYLVNHIVKSLKGSIKLESELGKGSRFSVRLPFLEGTKYAAESRFPHIPAINYSSERIEVPVKSGQKYSVLIVEDNIDLLNFMNLEISKTYRVFPAVNGREAFEIITQVGSVDIIIADVMMDVMNGYELFDELRKVQKYKSIPFIFISAKVGRGEKIKALELGAVDYIYKPFEIEELLNKITSIVKLNEIRKLLMLEEKYAAIGKLTSGITHQIFNPLSSITTPTYYIRQEIDRMGVNTPKLNEAFDDIAKNVKRIEETIKHLKILSYSKIDSNEAVNLRNIVLAIVSLYETDITSRIEFILDFNDGFTINTNANALINIMMNIIQNSVDAIDGKGYIRISTEENDNRIVINIEDNGMGIEEDDLDNIFDVDFTTKPIGKGTGLGLYIVKNLVEQLNMSIQVESKKGEGTTSRLIQNKEGRNETV